MCSVRMRIPIEKSQQPFILLEMLCIYACQYDAICSIELRDRGHVPVVLHNMSPVTLPHRKITYRSLSSQVPDDLLPPLYRPGELERSLASRGRPTLSEVNLYSRAGRLGGLRPSRSRAGVRRVPKKSFAVGRILFVPPRSGLREVWFIIESARYGQRLVHLKKKWM